MADVVRLPKARLEYLRFIAKCGVYTDGDAVTSAERRMLNALYADGLIEANFDRLGTSFNRPDTRVSEKGFAVLKAHADQK